MKFGVNVSAPFIGMKRDEGSDYPYAKHVSDVQDNRTTGQRTEEHQCQEFDCRVCFELLAPILPYAYFFVSEMRGLKAGLPSPPRCRTYWPCFLSLEGVSASLVHSC